MPTPSISVIIPVYNAAPYINACLESIADTTLIDWSDLEVCIVDDASTDGSDKVMAGGLERLQQLGIGHLHIRRLSMGPSGVGSARNAAIEMSCGQYFIFLDADDILLPERIFRQVEVLRQDPDAIVGGNFERIPEAATPRYVEYHRRLRTESLFAFAFRDAPLAMPTLALTRAVWCSLGGFVPGIGVPEDLHLLYGHMGSGGRLIKLEGPALVLYRYHETQTSRKLHRHQLLQVRVRAFEQLVLCAWSTFMVWGAGRDGRAFFQALSEQNRAKVTAWLDVDIRKIGRTLEGRPILHFSQAQPPLVTCVALDRTNGAFEGNLDSLNLRPGEDFFYLI